jgi:hypothetical protein
MAKRIPLVCQHLENISREGLEKYQDVIRVYVRHRQGVYALYRRKKLYYVGLATDLRWRLKAHLKDHHGQSWDRFSVYFTIGDQHLKELESLILRIAKPKGNKVKGKFKSSQDLRRKFAGDIRMLYRRELAMLLGRELAEKAVGGKVNLKTKGRAPVLSRYVSSPIRLRAVHLGKLLTAQVRRDGSVRFRGRVYKSPSAAGSAAVGGACNGWWFWKFERAPGDWIRLRELKK